ncbi:2OG-Fe(II) oxygenase superfamily protein [Metarhizium guizhouense ARSEF 977]|uniref:2OG-Fe(II) oxygenase superfamily protein n=1 Tax=Metarhizium guizhouense (strain ARSEF 977) TaxID=1276136 RepID=A0A0B4HAC5_METGA|nr:2OG-Fe(II) oxygenase superfamily protein [Metarhizium guizhouense ARSEF 977]
MSYDWGFNVRSISSMRLSEDLANVPLPRSFQSINQLPGQIPGGLFVDGVGDIAMPLNETQARQMIEKAHPLPPGESSYRNTDVPIRGNWVLDANKFFLHHPDWPSFLQPLCDQASRNLGINTRVTAKPFQMHIYEAGNVPSITEHSPLKDERPGMFGLMLLCLPSGHEGGEITMRYPDMDKMWLRTSECHSFACFYPQSLCEVAKVYSGFLWLLVFDIGLDLPVPLPLKAAIQQPMFYKLRGSLERWLSEMKQDSKYMCAYHLLHYTYTKANFSFQGLKMQDLDKVQALKALSREFPIEILLAELEDETREVYLNKDKDVNFDDDGDGDVEEFGVEDGDDYSCGDYSEMEEDESKTQVKALVDLDGNLVLKGTAPNGVDLQGHLQYRDQKLKKIERDAAIAIVPHASWIGFIKPEIDFDVVRDNLDSMIRYFGGLCVHQQASESLGRRVLELCDYAWQRKTKLILFPNRNPILTGDAMFLVLQIAVGLGEFGFLTRVAEEHDGDLPPDFFIWLRQWLRIGETGAKIRFQAIVKGQVYYMALHVIALWHANCSRISVAVSNYKFFIDGFKAIGNLAPLSKDNFPDQRSSKFDLMDWARKMLCECIDASASMALGNEDGQAIVRSALYFHNPLKFISQTVAPRLEQRNDAIAFFLTFRHEMLHNDPFAKEISMHVHQTRSLIHVMDFERARKTSVTRAYTDLQAKRLRVRAVIIPELLTDFFSDVVHISTETDNPMALLISKITAGAANIKSTEFHILWLPFLHSIIPILISNGIPLHSVHCQTLFSVILSAFVKVYVGKRPLKNGTLALSRVPCGCSKCGRLNTFLRSPTQRVGSFSKNSGVSSHLEAQLKYLWDAGDLVFEKQELGLGTKFTVTKTDHARILCEWNSRRDQAREKMSEFDQRQLQLLLGSHYSAIFNVLNQQPWCDDEMLWVPLDAKLRPFR